MKSGWFMNKENKNRNESSKAWATKKSKEKSYKIQA
jgi:hypothetical protein